jgi:hypothetical protein
MGHAVEDKERASRHPSTQFHIVAHRPRDVAMQLALTLATAISGAAPLPSEAEFKPQNNTRRTRFSSLSVSIAYLLREYNQYLAAL